MQRVLVIGLLLALLSLSARPLAHAQDAAPSQGAAPWQSAAPSQSAAPAQSAAPSQSAAPAQRAATATARDAETPARRMATRSLTLLAGAQVAPSAAAPLQVGLDVVMRIVPVRGFFLQPRLGASFNGTIAGVAWSWVLHAGLGAGWIAPLGRELAIALSAGYDLILLGSLGTWLAAHRVTAELALPVSIGRAVLEPYLQLGTQHIGNGVDAALGLGVRAGITW